MRLRGPVGGALSRRLFWAVAEVEDDGGGAAGSGGFKRALGPRGGALPDIAVVVVDVIRRCRQARRRRRYRRRRCRARERAGPCCGLFATLVVDREMAAAAIPCSFCPPSSLSSATRWRSLTRLSLSCSILQNAGVFSFGFSFFEQFSRFLSRLPARTRRGWQFAVSNPFTARIACA